MTEPAPYDDKVTPAAQLAGRSWPIPELAPRQLRVIRRYILDLTTALEPDFAAVTPEDEVAVLQERNACLSICQSLGLDAAVAAIQARSEKPIDDKMVVGTGEKVVSMTAAQYEMLTDVVYYGLTRAHPQMTRDEFLDMPCTDGELYFAFLIVRRQSGLFVSAGSRATPGEAGATDQTS